MNALQSDIAIGYSHLSRPEMAKLIKPLDPKTRGLEIGCWKGETTVWLLEQGILHMTVIDTFLGSEEHDTVFGLRKAFDDTTAGYQTDIEVIAKPSIFGLAQLLDRWHGSNDAMFDFIYVDGSHNSRDVIGDAVMAFPLLRSGGLMIFDDYKWRSIGDFTGPNPAITFFVKAFGDRLTVASISYQLAIHKK